MLAYLFWHRPYDKAPVAVYERALVNFHEALAQQELSGFRASASFRVGPLPWLRNRSGYEDWYLVDGSWALDSLNTVAITDPLINVHDPVATLMEEGHGGLYALVSGECTLPEKSMAVWLTRPRGIQWRPILDKLHQKYPNAIIWRRQMVLGPGKEFVVIVPGKGRVAAPSGWTALSNDRARL